MLCVVCVMGVVVFSALAGGEGLVRGVRVFLCGGRGRRRESIVLCLIEMKELSVGGGGDYRA